MRSIIDLARNLGLKVVAEGIEDQDAWDVLREMGCDVAQGYFLSRPVPGHLLTPWLAERTATARRPAADQLTSTSGRGSPGTVGPSVGETRCFVSGKHSVHGPVVDSTPPCRNFDPSPTPGTS